MMDQMDTKQDMPPDYITATTTTTQSTRVITPRFDPSYFRTIPGILKVLRMVLDLLGFICIMATPYYGPILRWFNFVCWTSFCVTASLLLLYLLHTIERIHNCPWMLVEFIYCAVWTLCYLIAASCVASWGLVIPSMGAAAFFGFSAMIVYGVDAYLKFRGWRNGEFAQGDGRTPESTEGYFCIFCF